VTDYIDSDRSMCSVTSVDDKIARMDAADLLLRQLGQDAREIFGTRLRNQHTYVEANVWDGPTSLILRVSGYGDTDLKRFTEFYSLHLPLEKPQAPTAGESSSKAN
jgi:hypothetical protein